MGSPPSFKCGERWEFAIAAYNEAGQGPFSTAKSGQCGTDQVKFQGFGVGEVGQSWARLEWDLPKLNVVKELWIYVTIDNEHQAKKKLTPESTSYTINNLKQHSNVTSHIKAVTSTFEFLSDKISFFTNRALYDITPVRIIDYFDNGTADVILPKIFQDDVDQPVYVTLVVLPWLDGYNKKSPDVYPQIELERMMSPQSSKGKQFESKPWIGAKWRWTEGYYTSDYSFTIGDNKQYMGYINKPLSPGFDYYLFIRLENTPTKPYNHSSTGLSAVMDMKSLRIMSKNVIQDPIQSIIISSVVGSVFLVSLFIIVMRRKVTGKDGKDFKSGKSSK